jgi:hypothetical protein
MDKDKNQFPIVPRLLDVHLAAIYLSVGEQTIRDYVTDGILHPVALPGSILRARTGGQVIAKCHQRKMVKILIDRKDIDALIDLRKNQEE